MMMKSDGMDKGVDENESVSPIDSAIADLRGYMKNPETITKETLRSLMDKLLDVKDYFDMEEQGDNNDTENENPEEKKGFSIGIMIGKSKKGTGK